MDTTDIFLHTYSSYEEYVAVQTEGNRRKLHNVWARRENLHYMVNKLVERGLDSDSFAVCHGTRNGAEISMLTETGLFKTVIGTEIAETALQFRNTLHHDFHTPLPAPISQPDVIYSNSLDHAHDPVQAIWAWAGDLKPSGFLVIEHSDRHEPSGAGPLDPFGLRRDLVSDFVETSSRKLLTFEVELTCLPSCRPDPGYITMFVFRACS